MKRILTRVFWVFFTLVGVLVCLWLVSRLRGPSEAQVEAMALLQERAPVPAGGNAFAAIWLLGYDVPQSQLQTVAETDFAQSSAMTTPAGDGMRVEPVRTGLAQFEYQAPSIADAQLFCRTRDTDCLDRVRADPTAYDGLIERNQSLLDRVVALQQYGYYRSPEVDPTRTMLPPFQYAAYDLTRVAWQFSRGEVDAALTGACEGAHAWRRLGAHSDSLLARAIGTGYVEGYTGLLARMLAELPASQAIPDACTAAFATPAVADASICEAMRGEFALSEHHLRQFDADAGEEPSLIPGSHRWVFDPDKTLAILAAGNAWACSGDTNNALQNDIRLVQPPSSTGLSLARLECVANPSGCILADTAFPAYYDYQWKAQDHAARLELMNALLWLRGNADPDRPPQSQLTAYWEQRRRGDRELRFEDDGRAVALQLYAQGPDRWWSLPFFPEGS